MDVELEEEIAMTLTVSLLLFWTPINVSSVPS